jgi:hypothetical protein
VKCDSLYVDAAVEYAQVGGESAIDHNQPGVLRTIAWVVVIVRLEVRTRQIVLGE